MKSKVGVLLPLVFVSARKYSELYVLVCFWSFVKIKVEAHFSMELVLSETLQCFVHCVFIFNLVLLFFISGFYGTHRLVEHGWIVSRVVWVIVKWLLSGPSQKSPPTHLYCGLYVWEFFDVGPFYLVNIFYFYFLLINTCISWRKLCRVWLIRITLELVISARSFFV